MPSTSSSVSPRAADLRSGEYAIAAGREQHRPADRPGPKAPTSIRSIRPKQVIYPARSSSGKKKGGSRYASLRRGADENAVDRLQILEGNRADHFRKREAEV
jgi:hypothetical protein